MDKVNINLEAFLASPQQTAAFEARGVDARYISVMTCALRSELDAIQHQFAQIEAREEALQCRLGFGSEGVLLRIDPQLSALWNDVLQLQSQAEEDIEKAAQDLACRCARQISIEDGPLMVLQPIEVNGTLRLLMTAAAELLDVRSLVLISEELAHQHKAGEDTIAYADYAGWRAELIEAPENANLRQFWQQAHSIEDDARPESLGGEKLNQLPNSLITLNLAGLDCPPKEAAAALWAYYVMAISGSDRMSFAVEFDGRGHEQLNHAIGLYAQYLPVLLEAGAGEPALDFIAHAREKLARAAAAQDIAEQVLKPNATTCAIRTFENAATSGSVIRSDQPFSAIDVSIFEQEEGVCIDLSLDSTSFTSADLTRFKEGFIAFVERVLTGPTQPISGISVMGSTEEQRRTDALTGSRIDEIDDFIVAFQKQATQTPNATAVSCDGRDITYEALAARASKIAWELAHMEELAEGQVLPIVASASIESLSVILGAVWANVPYAPLDPTHPVGLLQNLIDRVGAKIVFASGDIAKELTSFCKVMSLDLPTGDDALDTVAPDAAATAYVIFTSGSTGARKGVEVTRGGLSNYCAWAAREYGLDHPDGALVFGSIAVDMTITAFLAPLTSGGTVRLLPDSMNINQVAQALSGPESFALFKTTPSVMRAILKLMETPATAVKSIVVGGEALFGQDLDEIRGTFGTSRVFNEYGPTETVVGSVAFEATDWHGAAHEPVPIGSAIANTRLDVIRPTRQQAPIGVKGELQIAGAGVAKGYFEDAEQTSDRFAQGIYRTGDSVSLSAAGILSYHGRLDDEFKVNGVRCHPSEIIAAFLAVPGVSDAAVVLHSNNKNWHQLVAFVVSDESARTWTDVPEEVRNLLPSALIPNRIVALPEIPKTSSGKVDRGALESAILKPAGPEYESPQGSVEETLSAVICTALELERFGRTDNYFAKGGDSLKSVQVSALAKQRGIDISVAQIHRSPVLLDMALSVYEGDTLLAPAPDTAPFSLISDEDRALMTADMEDAYPLNLLQEGMIYHRDFAPKSAVYHAICSYRIRAHLDVDLMKQVIHDLVARHPLLRTSFDLATYSRPLQVVHKSFDDPVKVFDLRDASDSVFFSAVDGWMEHEKRTGFDVDSHPLIRYALHIGAGGVFQLSYSFHHEIIDGWSDAYMVTELLRDYFARLNGEAFRPPNTKSTFRDAIAQELEVLADPAFKNFWMQEFDGAKLMRLPRLDAPHRADKGEREIVKFEIPISDETSDRLKALSRDLAVPLKTVLLAVHMRVMSAIGGARDTTSYTVGNGRPENADGHAVIGLFVNSLAFRLNLQGGTWRDLIAATLAQEQKVLPYRRYPMAELKRQAGNDPLSETLFFFNHYHVADVLDGRKDATLEGINVYGESTFPYCVNAYISPVSKKVGMRVEYDLLQFTPRLLATMEQIYLNVISSMLDDPDAAYDQENLLPPSEYSDLCSWGTSEPVEPQYTSIVAQIDAMGRAAPDRLGVVHDGRSMSWGRLLRLSEEIAGWLVARGVKTGSRVALLLPRCLEMPAIVLGVLRAGCSYIPLDPTTPQHRLSAMLADADPAVVIGQSAGFEKAVSLTELLREVKEAPAVGRVPISPDMPAYIIYTSGTTGAPKGVVISNGALLQSTAARLAYYGGGHESFLLLSSYVFDSSVAGLFGTLASGGTLVLPSGDAALDLLDLAMLVNRHRVTHTLAVPSLYSAMLRDVRKGSSSSLEVVMLAGEAVPVDLLECHRVTLPNVTLVNEYGPTEATVWASAWRDDGRSSSSVSLGQPVAGTCCSIYDEFGHVAPIGVSGEACLSGPLLANGYLNRPSETADAFRPDPASTIPGSRSYRTGDVMRWGPNGELQFLGRQDNQIKLDGYRIELADIEAALLSHPGVRSCVVQPMQGAADKVRLTAYAVPDGSADVDPGSLEKHLRNVLPRFMLPDHYCLIDTMPLGPSGKIERTALSGPKPDTDTAHIDPASPTEEVLVAIWSDVIGLRRVSTHRRFFDLGGDSLRAMRIVAAVQKALGVRVEMALMMNENCNIQELAKAIDQAISLVHSEKAEAATEAVELMRV